MVSGRSKGEDHAVGGDLFAFTADELYNILLVKVFKELICRKVHEVCLTDNNPYGVHEAVRANSYSDFPHVVYP